MMLRAILFVLTVVLLAVVEVQSQSADDTRKINPPECGRPTKPPRFDRNKDPAKIVGGFEAIPNFWNWQVSVMNYIVHNCGGSVLNSQWILTAAHCIDKKNLANMKVRLGSHSRTSGGEVLGVEKVFVHPGYNTNTLLNDIGLIKLNTTIQYKPEIGPVCLAEPTTTTASLVEKTVIVTGWGSFSDLGSSPTVLHQVAVKVVSDEVCDAAYGSEFFPSTMICAADEGKDSCQGDSGGPLVFDDGTGVYKQMGIVSWGEGCAEPEFPGVYTKVPPLRAWLEGIIEFN